MLRYFFEVSYVGTNYGGFQIQKNANTIQGEVEKALSTLIKKPVTLTGSSRTDAGVHAYQNYFHGDFTEQIHPKFIYNLNAILPKDIAIKSIQPVNPTSHCRFDALSREYHYKIYNHKDPFVQERGYFYPYKLNLSLLEQAAHIVLNNTNFIAFSKSNVQVNNYNCTIHLSEWSRSAGEYSYRVKANRFLRGMVRALVATMLKVGRGKISIEQFANSFINQGSGSVDFSAPAQGLYLVEVVYPLSTKSEP